MVDKGYRGHNMKEKEVIMLGAPKPVEDVVAAAVG